MEKVAAIKEHLFFVLYCCPLSLYSRHCSSKEANAVFYFLFDEMQSGQRKCSLGLPD
jgi:hypothetical protein